MRRPRTLTVLFLTLAIVIAGAGTSLAAPNPGKGNVDELRFGANVDADGVVPEASHADKFNPNTPIHVTMKVQEAPEGTELMLNILDRETEEVMWSEKKVVPGGHAVMHFIVSELQPGKYRAKVKLADDWVAEHEFQIEQTAK
jgi:hypothetical protein